MTQEEKAKRYDEALERARKEWVENLDNCYTNYRERLEIIFPELKESDDERIRKKLICFVENWEKYNPNSPFDDYALYTSDRDECDKILSWLEKQKSVDEEELKKGALKYVARQFMNWLDASIPEDEMCLSNAECKIIEDAFLKDDWARISYYMCKKLKRQSEQIELKKIEQGNHPRIVMADFNGGEGFFKLNLDNLNKEQVDAIEMMINNPKQGKQTQLDYEHANIPKKDFAPIEPKFKVGDWVVKQNGENFWNGDCVTNITNITDCDKHWLNIDCWVKAEDIRLWTIQDAKCGDVLISGKIIFIFRIIQDLWINCYCILRTDGSFYSGPFDLIHMEYSRGIYPATKEQRDLLFSKMKEAGWEWDAEKKELRKIESKKLDSDKVIEWIHKYWPFSWGNFSLQVDDAIDKFKKDFELC